MEGGDGVAVKKKRESGENCESGESCLGNNSHDSYHSHNSHVSPTPTTLSHWRETGEWWSGEPQKEIVRFIDAKGIRREKERMLPTVGKYKSDAPKEDDENYSEEWNLRLKKTRDEKVARACGLIPKERILEEDEARASSPCDERPTHRGALRGEYGMRIETPLDDIPAAQNAPEHTLRAAEELAPYGVSRKEIGRARRLRKLKSGNGEGGEDCQDGEDCFPNKPHYPHHPHDPHHPCIYAPLHLYSGYAFGRGTMLAEEIPLVCASAGIPAACLADPFSLAGCVEFVKRSIAAGIKPLVGISIELSEGGWLVLIAKSKIGYQNLSELISACHLEEPRQFPLCNWQRLEKFSRDLICLTGGDIGPINRLISHGLFEEARTLLQRLTSIYGNSNVFIEIERSYLPWEIPVNKALLQMAKEMDILPVAGGVVTHARPDHFPSQDILVCAETLCTVDEIIGRKPRRHPDQQQLSVRPERALNAERYLKTPQEMCSLFSDLNTTYMSYKSYKSNLIENTLLLAEKCEDDVLPSRTRLPEIFPDPAHALREITYAGAHMLHGQISPRLKKRLEYELERMVRLNFADHFLAICDACRWAREQGIQLSGRGSVVDSAVAYCLGLSRIDAFKHNLHFDRFLPADGSKRPDIDVDFEAKRRDDVRKYFSDKYGADRVAGIAAIGAYCTRGIIREVGKALGLPNDVIGYLAKKVHGGIPPDQLESALAKRPELARSGIPKERFRWVFELSERLMDIPRNMRSHSSGLILSSRPIRETAPLMWSASPFTRERIPSDLRSERENGEYGENGESCSGSNSHHSHNSHDSHPQADLRQSSIVNRQSDLFPIIQWDKRSAKHFFDKFDILCLRGQDVLSGTQERIRLRDPDFNVEQVPSDDEDTYRAMRSGELIGIPQSASPAMRQAHIRLRTKDLHDASLVQAGIRPGVGGAVKINELIARRRGKPYSFEHPELERILGLTYGIIVFQEQVDQLLQAFCRYTSGEAEEMREAIHKRRREDYGEMMKQQIVGRVVSNGFTESVASQVYDYVSGFKGYGFAQGHALAFAEISIRSIYCQQNFPAEYFASLLTAQPAGYYGPCTLVNEARTRGVKILPPDVNLSKETFSIEDVQSEMDPKIILPNAAIRVGLMQVMGLSKETRKRTSEVKELREDGESSENGESCSGNNSHNVHNSHNSHVFASFFHFVSLMRPDRDELENLILCGAFDSLHPNRRALLWAIPRAMEYGDLQLNVQKCEDGEDCEDGFFSHEHNPHHPHQSLPLHFHEPEIPTGITDFSNAEKAVFERSLLDLDVERHLMAFERERVSSRGGITSADAKKLPPGRKAIVVGNPIRLRFPPTPSGKRVVFFDLEDETGLLNVTCFDAVYKRDGHAIVCSPYVTIIGIAQDRDGHTAFLAQRVFAYQPHLGEITPKDTVLPLTTADFLVG